VTKAAQAVLADALRLDLDARAELAAELLASLDGPADPDAEAAWAAEIQRSVEEMSNVSFTGPNGSAAYRPAFTSGR
jgi:uncharacterized protein (DUF1778 family)